MIRSITFWQDVPSIHQAPLLRELAVQFRGEVTVVTAADISAERIAQGWPILDVSPARLIVSPTRQQTDTVLAEHGTREDAHIFSGLHAYPLVYANFKRVIRTAAMVGVFAEAGRTDQGLRTVLRRMRYRVHALRWGRSLDFLLACGSTGVDWYSRAGFATDTIFPFGYFVQPPQIDPFKVRCDAWADDSSHHTDFRLLYVGALSAGKNVGLLISALSRLMSADWRLDIVGSGPTEPSLRDKAKQESMSNRIAWHGNVSNKDVYSLMCLADLLVLPSLYDGWGAVVSEALSVGTRVIVSDRCGAADLVGSKSRGSVFQSNSAVSIGAEIAESLELGKLDGVRRQRIIRWAQNAIAPKMAAKYLIEILSHVHGDCIRPQAPWIAARASD